MNRVMYKWGGYTRNFGRQKKRGEGRNFGLVGICKSDTDWGEADILLKSYVCMSIAGKYFQLQGRGQKVMEVHGR